jgi:hypothetical protein
MAKPGRRSSADLSIVTPFPSQRPPHRTTCQNPSRVSGELSLDACRGIGFHASRIPPWLPFVGTPVGRVCLVHRSPALDKCLKTEEGVKVLDKLLGMLERETRAVAALSRSMRLTAQTRVEKGAAGRMTSGPRPSFYQSMGDDYE